MNVLSIGASVGLNATGLNGSAAHNVAQLELRIGLFVKGELEVVSYEGDERMNAPYVYDVTFASSIPLELLQLGAFGFPACLSIQVPEHDPRVIQGLAVGIEAIGCAEAELRTKTRRYRARIVPRLWLLNHNRKYRVFQNKSAIEIACAVLGEAGITPTLRLQKEDYPPIPFTYQRGETDLEFLRHVLAVAGVFFYFAHASGFLDELLPGAGAFGALAEGLGGTVAGAADLSGAVGVAGAGIGGSIGGAGSGDIGGLGGAVSSVAQSAASALGALTTLVLSDRARHTHALQDASVASAAGAAASAGLGELGGAMGGAMGSVASAVGTIVGDLTEGLGDTIPFDANGQAGTSKERVFSFRIGTEVRPKGVIARDWNLGEARGVRFVEKSSLATLDVSAGISAAVNLTGHGGFSAGMTADLTLDALPIATSAASVVEYQRDAALLAARDPFAERALRQLRSDRSVGHGESDCRRFAPGYRFRVSSHPIEAVNTEYLVTAVRTTGYAAAHLPRETRSSHWSVFECVPASVDPLPPKPAPRPLLGLEVAVVVGPVWGDVNCDSLGRIQVRFRWSEPSPDYDPDADGTCWVYWLERWAGNGFGSLSMPRVGTEVLLDFLQEEGGQPIAIGQLYSRANRPPFLPPHNAATVGFRSSSLLSRAGYCEISADDATDTVRVRAQADMRTDVLRDHEVNVHRDQRVRVDGAVDARVGGSVREDTGGDETAHIRGTVRRVVDQDSLSTVGGNAEAEIRGHAVTRVAQSRSETIRGSAKLDVGRSLSIAVQQSHDTHIGGTERRTVGDAQITTIGSGASPATCDLSVSGTYRLSAKDTITIEAGNGLILRCGDTSLHLTPDSLALAAATIQTAATKQLELTGAGPSLTFGDEMVFVGKRVLLQSSGARLELSDNAALTGGKVKLGSGSGTNTSSQSSSQSPQALSLTVLDIDGAALANRPYQLRVGDLTIEGETDGSGALHEHAPADAVSARLTVWAGEFPTGRRIQFDIGLAPLGAPHEFAGAQERLRNLGHLAGPVSGRMDAATRDALLVFQFCRSLPTTGLLDDATVAALAEAHP